MPIDVLEKNTSEIRSRIAESFKKSVERELTGEATEGLAMYSKTVHSKSNTNTQHVQASQTGLNLSEEMIAKLAEEISLSS
jgi:hypothetical protein